MILMIVAYQHLVGWVELCETQHHWSLSLLGFVPQPNLHTNLES